MQKIAFREEPFDFTPTPCIIRLAFWQRPDAMNMLR
jgi:hypothetical protein